MVTIVYLLSPTAAGPKMSLLVDISHGDFSISSLLKRKRKLGKENDTEDTVSIQSLDVSGPVSAKTPKLEVFTCFVMPEKNTSSLDAALLPKKAQ
ncbi:hypothetical protein RRG08_056487 [Elysia crispata]|uniref:Uncharacterized protein n=1 Tax=Elysia crispata TaxID=231223 RepID=A0AAE0XS24_9GAST|nr:hypothetical protein RRG08_056487 [Elysia crispata]